jgi:hypothetical protein
MFFDLIVSPNMKTCCGFVPLKLGVQLIAFFVGCIGVAGFFASVVILATKATHIDDGPFHFDCDWMYIMFVIIAVVDITSSLVLYFGIVSEPKILSWFIGQCSCIVGLFIIFVAVASAQMVNHIWVILLLLGFKTYFVIVIFSYYRSIFNQGMVIN